jgi:hypothetical protein
MKTSILRTIIGTVTAIETYNFLVCKNICFQSREPVRLTEGVSKKRLKAKNSKQKKAGSS